MSNKLVSILIISRGRFNSLLKALDSIIKKSKDISRVEVILRFDEDDKESLDRIDELPKDKVDINVIVGKRYFYEFLHKYVNEACEETKGEFILWFNDDCVIETQNWDDIVAEYRGRIVCLYPNNKGTGSGNIFPLISRKVYEILGHFAKSQQVDSWQFIVGSRAGIEVKRDDLIFIHNRKQAYVSDEDRNAVLKRTRTVWKKSDKLITEDADKIKEYVKNNK